MSDKLKIKSMVFETKNGSKIELSIEEMQELYSQLHPLFGTKETTVVKEIIVKKNVWPWINYSVQDDGYTNYRYPNHYTITCSSNNIKLLSECGVKSSYSFEEV